MTSARQLAANQRNAQLSTGPTTAEGKRRSSRNAITHGAFVAGLLPGESVEEWAAHRERIFLGLRVKGYIEELYAERIADAHWRLRRVHRFQAWLAKQRMEAVKHERYCGLRRELDKVKEDVRLAVVQRNNDAELAEQLQQVLSGPRDTDIDPGVASDVLSFAIEVLQAHAPKAARTKKGNSDIDISDRKLHRAVGSDPDDLAEFEGLDWTYGLVRTGVRHLAKRFDHKLDDFTDLVQTAASKNTAWHSRTIATLKQQRKQLRKDLRKLERQLSDPVALPDTADLEKLMRCETHLTRMAQRALNELERVQRLRGLNMVTKPKADEREKVNGAKERGAYDLSTLLGSMTN